MGRMGDYGPDYKLSLPGLGPVERWPGEWEGAAPNTRWRPARWRRIWWGIVRLVRWR